MTYNIDISFPNLGINIDNFSSSFIIFGLRLSWCSVFYAAGAVIAILIAIILAKRSGSDISRLPGAIFSTLVFGFISARLYYVIFGWAGYKGNIEAILYLKDGGFSIFGAFIGGLFGAWLVYRKQKKELLEFLDAACLSAVLGICIGRWGDFFSCDNFGGYTDGLFAMRLRYGLTTGTVTEELIQKSFEAGIWNFDSADYIQVHPAFLYESVGCLIIFVLVCIFGRFKKYDGQKALWALGGYCLLSVFTFSLRTDALTIAASDIKITPLLGGIIFITLLCILTVKRITAAQKRNARSS